MEMDEREETGNGHEERDEKREEGRRELLEFIGPPMNAKFQALEEMLKQDAEEERREEAEKARLAPLRLERLKKVLDQLSDAQRREVKEALFEGDMDHLWDVRQVATSGYRERDAAQEQREYEADCAEVGETEANQREVEREAQANSAEWRSEPPLWQQVSGLYADEELAMRPNRRAQAIRKLLRYVEKLVRVEVRRTEVDRTNRTNGTDKMAGDEREGDDGAKSPVHCDEDAGETPAVRVDATRRTGQWDPLRTICLYLGIAQRKLSALSREISGLSAAQLCDAIKAERLRKNWKRRISEWVGKETEKRGRGEGENLRERAFGLWKAMRAEVQRLGSHRASWAWGEGFSSYTRLFRACLICYGLAPQELELALIEESLGSAGIEDARCVFGQAGEKAGCGSDSRQDDESKGNGGRAEVVRRDEN